MHLQGHGERPPNRNNHVASRKKAQKWSSVTAHHLIHSEPSTPHMLRKCLRVKQLRRAKPPSYDDTMSDGRGGVHDVASLLERAKAGMAVEIVPR
jgi:hypothetical protein